MARLVPESPHDPAGHWELWVLEGDEPDRLLYDGPALDDALAIFSHHVTPTRTFIFRFERAEEPE